ncbi:MAG: hypothetical protein ACK48O_02505 [Flavobacteriia bacterium]
MKTNTTENALTYLTWEKQIASQLNTLGYFRLKELQANLFYAVQTYHNLLNRYEQLMVEELQPCRNENFLIGIEVRTVQHGFHFRATFAYLQIEKQLLGQLTYYSNESEKPKQIQIEANNHTRDPKQLVEAMHGCLLEEMMGYL